MINPFQSIPPSYDIYIGSFFAALTIVFFCLSGPEFLYAYDGYNYAFAVVYLVLGFLSLLCAVKFLGMYFRRRHR